MLVSGGTGFIGGAIARRLLERGDQVVLSARDPARAQFLAELGAEVVEDDLSEVGPLAGLLRGVDAAIHAAGSYRIGIDRSDRGRMWDANVGTTTRMLDAAEAAGLARLVYVSTANVFGNTHGQVVDETYRRDLADGFLSWYDETKYGAHELAEQRIAAGLRLVIVIPGQVYGPGDRSAFGGQLRQAFEGSLRVRVLGDVGICLAHVDDVASGIVAALDLGRVGESYALTGQPVRLRDAIALAAGLGGRRPPRVAVPTAVLRAAAVAGRGDLREVVRATAGVTYWASHDKASSELGFDPRPLEAGLRETFGVHDGPIGPTTGSLAGA